MSTPDELQKAGEFLARAEVPTSLSSKITKVVNEDGSITITVNGVERVITKEQAAEAIRRR